jgi:aspartate aminotransferase
MIGSNLTPDIESFLAPQERYERLRETAQRRTGRDLSDLGYANFYGGPPTPVIESIRESLNNDRALDFQYTPYGGATITRRLVAERLSKSLGLCFGWRSVIMTPGAMGALNILFRALRAEDSIGEVIVVVPSWFDYPLYLVNLGLKPVFIPVVPETLRLDMNRIADAISPATRAIILSHPANPTGLIYSPQELSELAGFLAAKSHNRILLISDECHRDTIFHGCQFRSPAEYYDTTCIVYSFGKVFHIQGQRIGYVAVSPRMPDGAGFARLLERLCRVTGFCTPTALMQLAVRRLLAVEIDSSITERKRDLAVNRLQNAGYDLQPSQATFFLYPRSPIPDDFRFVELLAQRGVLVLPAALFHHSGYFRMALTAPESDIERALHVLKTTAQIC